MFLLNKYLIGAVAVLGILGGAYWLGRQHALEKAKLEALEDFKATMERIDETDNVDLDDSDAVLERLCRHAGIADCPVSGD